MGWAPLTGQAFLVNSPPEITQFATDLDEHLVEIPGVT